MADETTTGDETPEEGSEVSAHKPAIKREKFVWKEGDVIRTDKNKSAQRRRRRFLREIKKPVKEKE